MIVSELGKEGMERAEFDDSTTDLDFYVDKVIISFFLSVAYYCNSTCSVLVIFI